MKNALILHGTNANHESNWFYWLKAELESVGWDVWLPDLPKANKPSIKRYDDFILSSNWKFDEDSVIVGHSSGAVGALGLLQALPDNFKIRKCVLVSAFINNLGMKSLGELFDPSLDFSVIKKRCREFVLIHSDNDPHVPFSQAEFLKKKLGAKLIIKKGQGHFNTDFSMKYKKFPLVLRLLK